VNPTESNSMTKAPLPASSRAVAWRRALRVLLFSAIPLGAVFAAWWWTREPVAASSQGNGHNHAGAPAAGGVTGPVMLTGDQARRIGVTFAPVTTESLRQEIRTIGQITFDETRVQTISSKVDGWVEQLFVDFTGRFVQKGEPLLRIYSPMLVTAQEELLLAMRLESDVKGGTVDARAGAGDLVSSARRRLAYWDVPAEEIARIERSGEVRRTLTMASSATGVVLEKNITNGQRVMAGDALFRVADLSTVWVEGDVYEQDLRAVRLGQTATAEFDAYPGEQWTGRITFVYPTLSADTRTARVRVSLVNPGVRLKPGMYATLRVGGAAGVSSAMVLTVPRSAVLVTGERSLVFVRRADGALEPREVTVGATAGDRIEIVRGVASGDTVVASATFLIDAESNLGTAMGGMGDMPGMEITRPPSTAPPTQPPSTKTPPWTPAKKSPNEGGTARPHAHDSSAGG
jgi:Cu(I)/Ag(I) efflux system membrane fusion protein